MRVVLYFLISLFASGCTGFGSDVNENLPRYVVAEATREYIVGHWRAHAIKLGYADELSFFEDGTYCAVLYPGGQKVVVKGRWTYLRKKVSTAFWRSVPETGEVTIRLNEEADMSRLPGYEIDWNRFFYAYLPDALLAGYSCSHCENGIAGFTYERISAPRPDCER